MRADAAGNGPCGTLTEVVNPAHVAAINQRAMLNWHELGMTLEPKLILFAKLYYVTDTGPWSNESIDGPMWSRYVSDVVCVASPDAGLAAQITATATASTPPYRQ